MSTLTIKLETGNAAFQDDGCHATQCLNECMEVARILHILATKVQSATMTGETLFDFDGTKLLDFNGNIVGEVEVDRPVGKETKREKG